MNNGVEITIREAGPTDAGAIARVHVDTWRTTYAGILPADFLADLAYANSESNWSQAISADRPGASMLVAETDGGEIVGFAYCAPEREGKPLYRGEIFAIYVLEEHQRKGVGRLLFSAAAQQLLTNGFDSMLLWVLQDNHPARHFYELMGGEYVEQKTITIGGTDIIEVAYGWKDITEIAVE